MLQSPRYKAAQAPRGSSRSAYARIGNVGNIQMWLRCRDGEKTLLLTRTARCPFDKKQKLGSRLPSASSPPSLDSSFDNSKAVNVPMGTPQWVKLLLKTRCALPDETCTAAAQRPKPNPGHCCLRCSTWSPEGCRQISHTKTAPHGLAQTKARPPCRKPPQWHMKKHKCRTRHKRYEQQALLIGLVSPCLKDARVQRCQSNAL